MNNIIIDEEFKRILPALDEQTYAWLEENILEYCCREPLVLWNDILIDGHNRYAILTKHDLPVNTVSMEFNSRDDVLIWIISTQVSRRNLNPLQLSFYRGLHYNADKRVQGTNNQFVQKSESGQNDHQQNKRTTADKLAENYNVSPKTIRRDAQVANALSLIGETSPDIKMDILSGKTRISRKQLQELSGGTNEDVDEIVSRISDGSFRQKGDYSNSSELKSNFSGTNEMPSGKSATDTIDLDDMQPWEKHFAIMTDEFRQLLRSHAKINDKTSAKSTLRQYITMLEELYWNI